MKLAVLGAGAWGTALALAFSGRHRVGLWTWQQDHAQAMATDRENVAFLRGNRFPDSLQVSHVAEDILTATDLAIVATPMAGLRSTLGFLAGDRAGLPFLWVCKGLEAGTGLLPHQLVADTVGPRRCGALTGP
jgi:glycerol-3-phosphate dehydrogenase (NAD(P)+)